MTPSPRKGISPKWANLPRRKCDNCGKSYKPARPLRPDQKYGFHSPECKKQFHKHGAAFIQLKDALEKLIDRRLRAVIREEIARYHSQA